MGLREDSEGIAKCLLASKWLISFNHWQQLRNYSWFSCWCPGAAKLLPTVKGSQLFLPTANAWHQGKLSDLILCQEMYPIHSAWGESPLWACCVDCLHSDEDDSSAPTLTSRSMCLLSNKQLTNSSDPSTRWDASTIISKHFWWKCEVPAQPAQYNWLPCQILLARGYERQKCLVPVPLHQKEHKKGMIQCPRNMIHKWLGMTSFSNQATRCPATL